MIKIRSLSYSIFGKTILDNISLDIKDQDKIILIGENGSGKSTLLRILTKAIPHSFFINSFKSSFYLSDSFYVPKYYYVRDYLIKMANIFNETADIDYLLGYFNLENKKIYELSKGNRQKLGIILGIISKREIIYYDEAFDGLDQETIRRLISYLNELPSAVVIVTHYPDLFNNLPFKRIYIRKGKICK